jgi:hypothetical protein
VGKVLLQEIENDSSKAEVYVETVFNVIQVYAKAGMNSEALQFMNVALGYI